MRKRKQKSFEKCYKYDGQSLIIEVEHESFENDTWQDEIRSIFREVNKIHGGTIDIEREIAAMEEIMNRVPFE